jgi:hypothetical protein
METAYLICERFGVEIRTFSLAKSIFAVNMDDSSIKSKG